MEKPKSPGVEAVLAAQDALEVARCVEPPPNSTVADGARNALKLADAMVALISAMKLPIMESLKAGGNDNELRAYTLPMLAFLDGGIKMNFAALQMRKARKGGIVIAKDMPQIAR